MGKLLDMFARNEPPVTLNMGGDAADVRVEGALKRWIAGEHIVGDILEAPIHTEPRDMPAVT
jgi:hypothetical protein